MKQLTRVLLYVFTFTLFVAPAAAQPTAEDFVKVSRERFQNRDLDGALAALDKAIELKPGLAVAYVERQRRREFRKRGDLTLAIADFNKTIELQPRIASLYLERGATFMELGKDEEAEKDFARCL